MRHSRKKKQRLFPWRKTAALLAVGVIVLCMNIRHVTVSGNSRYTKEELIDKIFQNRADWNAIYCYMQDRFGEHQQIPFIEDYSLVFYGPFEVELIVHEKSVVGYVTYMGSCMYFDKDGIIVESTNEKVQGIPCIEGLKFGQIVLHKSLPVEDTEIFEQILILTQVLSTHALKVDQIHFDKRGNATLYMEELEVVLGDISNVDGKILRLANMMPELGGLQGTLYLDTYDPSNNQMTFTFKKKS